MADEQGAPQQDQPDGVALMRAFLEHSPFARLLGLELVEAGDGRAEVRLPFRDDLATFGTVLHGGALASVADVAATVASFAGADVGDTPQGATVGLNLNYLRAARDGDVTARAHVIRRGKSLNFVDVEVVSADGTVVAKGQAIYKLG